jgi:ABC-type uncharacterized transport system fused permease/ATPase subunit
MENKLPSRKIAALSYALAIVRGQLSAVLLGKFDKDELARVLEGTIVANIASAIGQNERDLAIDWNDVLTEDEKQRIQGRS